MVDTRGPIRRAWVRCETLESRDTCKSYHVHVTRKLTHQGLSILCLVYRGRHDPLHENSRQRGAPPTSPSTFRGKDSEYYSATGLLPSGCSAGPSAPSEAERRGLSYRWRVARGRREPPATPLWPGVLPAPAGVFVLVGVCCRLCGGWGGQCCQAGARAGGVIVKQRAIGRLNEGVA